ncbi:hypothetical protein RSOLAG1IB_08578 [Rhizoctonia solani AG-1 IB]|uniref:Uncharacterized protein n=1 Tax=Thanatephorus cucumeris (strain AG1-IB / isolate 7/3/14) TaxID=1108050 RepID=A0A0B7FQR1_THACB|nr:hypothetical protein RSOLAG1IB_08578 [Rhizoctonia solani AG-1 IB]
MYMLPAYEDSLQDELLLLSPDKTRLTHIRYVATGLGSTLNVARGDKHPNTRPHSYRKVLPRVSATGGDTCFPISFLLINVLERAATSAYLAPDCCYPGVGMPE